MKVCSVPDEVPAPEFNTFMTKDGFNSKGLQDAEDAHQEALKAHLIGMGYKGKHTGRIYSTPIADGSAVYMFADAGAKSCLIHLPYGDGYMAPDVQHVPKAEIIRRLDRGEALAKLFRDAREKNTASK